MSKKMASGHVTEATQPMKTQRTNQCWDWSKTPEPSLSPCFHSCSFGCISEEHNLESSFLRVRRARNPPHNPHPVTVLRAISIFRLEAHTEVYICSLDCQFVEVEEEVEEGGCRLTRVSEFKRGMEAAASGSGGGADDEDGDKDPVQAAPISRAAAPPSASDQGLFKLESQTPGESWKTCKNCKFTRALKLKK